MRGLNFDQLRALLEVVEQGSFSAAARRLNLTQPAVSLQIRELERRFGLRLIERLGKRAHATIPGRELVEAAQRILRECNHADAAMRRFREGWTGRAHVGTTLTTMIYRLPPILRRVRLDHPGIDLVVGAVLLPGAKAPKLVRRDDLKLMKPGSVIVDVAVDQGGCIETSKPTTHDNPVYIVDGIIHYAVANMPGGVPRTSTLGLTNATFPYAKRLARHGWKQACKDDGALSLGLNVIEGKVVYPAVAEAFGLQHVDAKTLV